MGASAQANTPMIAVHSNVPPPAARMQHAPARCSRDSREAAPLHTWWSLQVWNLLLTRPYADGGGEHSGRVAQPGSSEHYEARRQTTATRVLRGRLNAPEGAARAVEMAG